MIGTVKRDVEFTVIACTNSIPDAPVTMTDLTGTEIQTGPTGLEMCVGDEFCLDLIFTDQNIGDSLTLTTNATLALPGATFTDHHRSGHGDPCHTRFRGNRWVLAPLAVAPLSPLHRPPSALGTGYR